MVGCLVGAFAVGQEGEEGGGGVAESEFGGRVEGVGDAVILRGWGDGQGGGVR